MALKGKPKASQVCLVFSKGGYLSDMSHVKANSNKVFAVIGPLDNHEDKPSLQEMLEVVCRGYNVKPK